MNSEAHDTISHQKNRAFLRENTIWNEFSVDVNRMTVFHCLALPIPSKFYEFLHPQAPKKETKQGENKSACDTWHSTCVFKPRINLIKTISLKY